MRIGDHLDFRSGRSAPQRLAQGRFAVYGSNGPIGYAAERNATGPVIVIGRVGTYCGTVRYCDTDVWVTDNALACRAKDVEETRYWYYALRACGLNDHRSGTGQPLLNQRILHDISVPDVSARDRRQIGALLGAVDDKIVANQRVIRAAEDLMVGMTQSAGARVPLATLATRSSAFLDPRHFPDRVAHFSLPAFDNGASPKVVRGGSVKSGKFLLPGPCVLVAKLNPRIPRIWNVVDLPAQPALASSEFVVLTPAGIDTSMLWAALRQPEVSTALQRRVVGTSGSHQRVHYRDLLEVRVRDVRQLAPHQAQTITKLGALCQTRRAEITRLSSYRDELLPLLISGEVHIADTAPARP